MVQTLVYVVTAETEKKYRSCVISGDVVESIIISPSWSGSNGVSMYNTARLVTARDRKSQWYKNAQFDELGNSNNLN